MNNEKKNNQINAPLPQSVTGYQAWTKAIDGKGYADIFVWMVVRQILKGLKNVNFYFDNFETSSNEDKAKMKAIAEFLNTNAEAIFFAKMKKGFVVVEKNGKTYQLPDYNFIRMDKDGRVKDFDIVYYTDTYQYQRKSEFSILQPVLDDINDIANGDSYLTKNLGAFGILCGKGMPLNPADKNNFLEKLKRSIGITSDRFQLETFTNEVNFQQVDFHLKDLNLGGKLIDKIKALSAFFGVPFDLIPFAGQSTYANQREAVQQLYSNCIKPNAETILEIGRYLVKSDKRFFVPSSHLTFEVQNVPELKDDRTSKIDYNLKVLDLLQKAKDLGLEIDTKQYINQLNQPIQ